jgi:serine/threonine-protein phosphatase 6 regulatory ankyrin repeat subunit B
MSKEFKNEYEQIKNEIAAKEKAITMLKQQHAALLQQQNQVLEAERIQGQINVIEQEIGSLRPTYQSLDREYNAAFQQNQSLTNNINILEKQIIISQKLKQEYDECFNDIDAILNEYSNFLGSKIDTETMVVKILPQEQLPNSEILKKACENQSIQAFEELIKKLGDINAVDANGMSLLMYALKHGFWYGVEKLLELGAEVNVVDKNGYSTLMYACTMPHIKYVSKIIALTEDVNLKHPKTGDPALNFFCMITPIIFASEKNNEFREYNVKHIRFIIDEPTNISAEELNTGMSCIIYNTLNVNSVNAPSQKSAYQEKINQIIRCLKEKGADLNLYNDEGITPLQKAIINNSFFMVQALVDLGADLNVSNTQGYFAWHYASYWGSLDILKFLKDKIPNIDFKSVDDSKITALWLAAQQGHVDIVKWLISEGADVNIISQKNGFSALHMAVQKNKLDVVQLLLHHNANKNIENMEGCYPMHLAISHGYLDMVNLLVDNSNLNKTNDNIHQVTPLWLASQHGKLEIVKFLANKGADLNLPRMDTQMPPLYIAMNEKQTEVVKELLSRNAAVNLIDSTGNSSLHWAVHLGDLGILQLILNKGIGINVTNSGGGTPLYGAVFSNDKPIVEFLLNKRANPNIPNNAGIYPMHAAADNGNIEIIKALVRAGVSINMQSTAGDSVAHYATQRGNLEMLRLLINEGANQNIQNNQGLTSFYLACALKNKPIAELLLQKQPNLTLLDNTGQNGLSWVAELQDTVLLQQVLNTGINIDHQDINGKTLLFWMVQYGAYNMVDFLIKKGANVNLPAQNTIFPLLLSIAKNDFAIFELLTKAPLINLNLQNSEGTSPFYLACLQGNIEIATSLQDKEVDINIINKAGYYPIHAAVHNGHIEVIKELLKWGVDIDTKSTNGYTPLQYYCELANNQLEVIKFLFDKGASLNCMQGVDNKTLLHSAVAGGNLQVIDFLINKGLDINLVDAKEVTPLYCALGYYLQPIDLAIVSFLIARGANVNKPMDDGDTPMHMIFHRGRTDLIKLLLAKGGNIKVENDDKKLPLHKLLANKDLPNEVKANVIKELQLVLSQNGIDALAITEEHNQEVFALLTSPVEIIDDKGREELGDNGDNLQNPQQTQELLGHIDFDNNDN